MDEHQDFGVISPQKNEWIPVCLVITGPFGNLNKVDILRVNLAELLLASHSRVYGEATEISGPTSQISVTGG